MLSIRKLAVSAVAVILTVTSLSVFAGLLNQPAPDFALHSLSGENLRLSEFRSEVVVLSFTADWCARCRQALPVYESLFRVHNDAGLQMLAVDIEGNTAGVAEQAQNFDLSFPFLLDRDQRVSRQYDLNSLPVTVVIDREGVIRFVDSGFRGDSEAQMRSVVEGLLQE